MMKTQLSSSPEDARGPEDEAMQPSTVLFLAANPVQGQPLQLGEECRAIEDKIRGAKFRDRIRFRSRWAARPTDLLEALTEDAPVVLHFSGHGTSDQGLCFQSEDGREVSVSEDGLAEVMRAEGASIKVVVLNACFSEVQARALVAHVPCVIGMPGPIGDKAAIVYSASFYYALANGRSVATAHQHGIAALALHRSEGQIRDIEPPDVGACTAAFIPVLLTRSDIDAGHVSVVRVTESLPVGPAVPPHSKYTNPLYVLTIKAKLIDIDADVVALLTTELRRLTNDFLLEIISIDEGSVRLVLSLSPMAAGVLKELQNEGKLSEIGGYDVLDLFELPASEIEHPVVDEDMKHQMAAKKRIINNEPDNDVIEHIQKGNLRDALRILIQRYGETVYQYCHIELRDAALAKDIHQQVFIEAFRDLAAFNGRSPITTIRTWLFAIARRRVLVAAKSRRRARGYDVLDLFELPASEIEHPVVDEDMKHQMAAKKKIIDDEPDNDVIEHIQKGNLRDALRILIQRYGETVYRYCHIELRDATLAEDIHQQVFIEAFRDLTALNGRSPITTIRTWLFAIARRRVLVAAKSRRRAREHLKEIGTMHRLDSSGNPEDLLDSARLRRVLVACVAHLSERTRTTLLLRFQHGYTYEEMAEILHEEPNILQQLVARTLPELRVRFQAHFE